MPERATASRPARESIQASKIAPLLGKCRNMTPSETRAYSEISAVVTVASRPSRASRSMAKKMAMLCLLGLVMAA